MWYHLDSGGPAAPRIRRTYREPSDAYPRGEQLLYDSFGRLPSAQWQPRLRGVETTERDPEQVETYENGASFCSGSMFIVFECHRGVQDSNRERFEVRYLAAPDQRLLRATRRGVRGERGSK